MQKACRCTSQRGIHRCRALSRHARRDRRLERIEPEVRCPFQALGRKMAPVVSFGEAQCEIRLAAKASAIDAVPAGDREIQPTVPRCARSLDTAAGLPGYY